MPKMSSSSRIRFISILMIIAAGAIVSRLFFVQVIHGSEYSESADRQYAAPAYNIFERGTISFKEKNGRLISAATLKSGFILAIAPSDIKNDEETFISLSSVVTLSREEFMVKAAKKEDPYEELAHRLTQDDADKINSLNLPGVSLYKEKWRFYPAGSLAAHALGFVAYDGDLLSGRYGLERHYENVLNRSESDLYANFFAEVFANLKKTLFTDSSRREGDLVLTIDPGLQIELEKELETIETKYSSKLTGGVVINPKDGRIYAMGKIPAFDLNNFKEEDPAVFSNPLVEDVYEFGSIIKPLTMAAALDAGAVTAKTKYDDTGSVTLNERTIYNFDKKGRGVVDMQEVLNQSLNTGAVFVMQKLGKEKFKEYFLGYGIGDKTGIDLPSEGRNLISNLSSGRDIEFANASFGQGIALTPIAAVRALSVLANGGYLITPHIVEKIDYKGGFSSTPSFPPKGQAIKKSSSEEITRMLVNVVDNALMGGTVKMDHYSVAAKTGTAQLLNEETGAYYEDRYLHSFFGYFPAYDPSFLIFLYTVDPEEEKYASQTLTGPFMNLAKFLINYYELPPDR